MYAKYVFPINDKPERVQAGRAQADSSVTAGSCWCSPESEAPGKMAGRPGPGWPGCRSYVLHAHGPILHSLHRGSPCCRGFFDDHLESHCLLHFLPCPSYLHRDLKKSCVRYQTWDMFYSSFCRKTCRNYAVRIALMLYIFLTCTGPIHLSHVPRWRYGRHNKVEWDGDVHGSHGTGACANHTDLVMGLEIHVGCTPCRKKK